MIDSKSTTISLPTNLWIFLKKQALKEKTTFIKIVRRALQQYKDNIKRGDKDESS